MLVFIHWCLKCFRKLSNEKKTLEQDLASKQEALAEMSETLQQKEADLQHHIQQVSIVVYLWVIALCICEFLLQNIQINTRSKDICSYSPICRLAVVVHNTTSHVTMRVCMCNVIPLVMSNKYERFLHYLFGTLLHVRILVGCRQYITRHSIKPSMVTYIFYCFKMLF